LTFGYDDKTKTTADTMTLSCDDATTMVVMEKQRRF